MTACDVGTYVQDMDVVARATRFATGRSAENGGAGDSSVLTAYGVFQGMRAGAEHLWGAPTLAGRTVGIAGVGKVGRHLVGHLVDDGATVVVTDVSAAAVDGVRQAHPEVEVVDDTAALVAADLDVYSPCALGHALTDEVVGVLSARLVCGGANNQLAHPGIEDLLAARGHPLRPGLLRERRRGDPGGRRAARLRLRAGQGQGRARSSPPRPGCWRRRPRRGSRPRRRPTGWPRPDGRGRAGDAGVPRSGGGRTEQPAGHVTLGPRKTH